MEAVSSLTVAIIRPSNYDGDGYVVRYVRGVFPSNTLACLQSLTLDFRERWQRDLGISITVHTYDELIEKVPFRKLARMNRGATKVVAVIAGVQTNQFARASDIAKRLTDLGIKTLIGGFHVSGVLAMFDEPTRELRELADYGVTLVQGEAEHVWESILFDVVMGKEKPIYRMTEYPDISESPVPQPNSHTMKKFALSGMGTIDCSRGCPFNCSFCTIINVQGKKMRYRSAESVLKTITDAYENGIRQYFFTDDNFSRNPTWEEIFDGLIKLREEKGIEIDFIMQVDMACDRIDNFVTKAAKAGCSHVFIGMESLNPKNIEAVGKKQNKVENYAAFIQSWHEVGVVTQAGYIIGFPYDTPESVRRDIERLKNEVKVDLVAFFILTPLPGSRDHFEMVQSGVPMDDDLNRYDSFHTVTDHPLMTREELYQAYKDAWSTFYDVDNLKNVLARARIHGYWNVAAFNLMWYKNSLLEPRHPMVTGFIRKKDRTDVRPGATIMGFLPFHLKRARELFSGFRKRISLFYDLQELWWLTRKPDDRTFTLITDFTATLTEAKSKIAAIDLNGPYAKWSEEVSAVMSSLSEKIKSYYNPGTLRGRTKRRFNTLIEDMNAYLDRTTMSEYYSRGVTFLSTYLARNIRLAEEYTLKRVRQRRSMSEFWKLTWYRLKHGKIISFAVSLPRIVVSALRDLRMSLSFTYHFFIHRSW